MTHIIFFRVIGADIDDAALELARTMGTDIVVNTRKQDLTEVGLNDYVELEQEMFYLTTHSTHFI